MGFPRQERWSGLPFPSPGDLPDSGIEPPPPARAGRVFTTEPPGKPTLTITEVLHISLREKQSIYFTITAKNWKIS